jgi:branched-subunit amino acid aminotransferase/4-amino-4-deoxychorismate lyase
MRAADSWLVVDGHARAVDRHWARFTKACALDLAEFRAEVERAIPSEGRWFPRVELHDDGALAFHVRPAPPREPTVTAWITDDDPRTAPRVKGPDLERLAALRDRAKAHGAQEAVIADHRGRLLEGAYTSLLWWEGDTLCAVPDDAPILPGITRGLLIEMANEVELRRPTLEELADRETWLVSALHGIRAVTRWVSGPAPGTARRAAEWQRQLESI